MMPDIHNLRRRTLQYWHIDGLTEIAFGAILLVLGAYFFAQSILPPGTLLYQVLDMAFVLLLVSSGLLAGRFVSLLKNRLTYPRTGYVAYPEKSPRYRWLGGILAAAIGFLVAGLISTAPASLAWMPTISALILSAVLCFLGFRFGLLRFFVLGILILAAGISLALAGIGDIRGMAIFYTLSGLAVLISGGLTLLAYLRSHPPLQEQP
jgi:hypothetical protein